MKSNAREIVDRENENSLKFDYQVTRTVAFQGWLSFRDEAAAVVDANVLVAATDAKLVGVDWVRVNAV